MYTLELIFWAMIFIVFYTYAGYGMLLYVILSLQRLFKKPDKVSDRVYEPEITLLIAAYNEKDYVEQKVRNCNELDYPAHKINQVWVTDGSDDGTPDLLKKYANVQVMHHPERNGKIAAINRGMKEVKTPLVIFSDANTLLGIHSVKRIVKLFSEESTGCVSGEKRIVTHAKDDAATAGEGMYWRYESTLKKWDAELNSVVGAAGELFAIRSHLFQAVEKDTILDDFIISLRIAMKGYKIKYDPEAYAIETASADVKEELKRKIRIAAGGIQSVLRLLPLLNIFKYKTLSFQYISHRVLRWTLAPLALLFILGFNIILVNQGDVYLWMLVAQLAFYLAALAGYSIENTKTKVKILFVPYYFMMMNYAVYQGFIRFLKKKQSVNWERAVRSGLSVDS